MSSAVIRAQVPSIPEPFPEPGRNRLLQLPDGVVPGARLEVRPAPATVPSGITEIDALTGGLPRGALTEIFGPASSGRTSMILAALAAATRRQEVCALVDAGDSLHPESAAAAGLDLQRLLWIRCGENPPQRHRDTEGIDNFKIDDLRIDDCRLNVERPTTGGQRPTTNDQRLTSPPRINTDQRGSKSIRQSSIFNRQSSVSPCLCGEIRLQSARNSKLETRNSTAHCSWDVRLAQVLKTTDLLLQSGGFGLVVVDLADVPPRFARRIPLASWFRFRRAVENTPTVLLVVEQEPYAKTCASLVLKMQLSALERQHSAFSTQHSVIKTQHSALSIQHSAGEAFVTNCATPRGGTPAQQSIFSCEAPAHAQILRGLPVEAEIVHARFQRKPARSTTQFHTRTAWADSVAG